MNAAERWVVRDYVHRKWTFYFLGAVIHMAAMLASWWSEPMILLGIFLGSAVVLNFELTQSGNTITRTLLSLPINAVQLGRCWRFATFSLPVIAGFLILSLSAIIAGFYGAPLLSVGSFVITAVTQTLLLGLVFFIITGLPRRGGLAASFPKKLSQIAFGLLSVVSYPLILVSSASIPRTINQITSLHLVTAAFLTAATIAGWFRATQVIDQCSEKSSASKKSTTKNPLRRAHGFGGIAYLTSRFSIGLIVTVLIFVPAYWVMMKFINPAGVKSTGNTFIWMVPLSGYLAIFLMLSQLRILRSMPITRAALTNLLVFWPLLLVILMSLAVVFCDSLVRSTVFDFSLWIQIVSAMALGSVILPQVLRFGISFWSIFLVMIPLFPLALHSATLRRGIVGYHPFYLSAAACVVLVAVWITSYRLLASPYPWRAGIFKGNAGRQRLG